SPDGQNILTGTGEPAGSSSDVDTIQLWNVHTGQNVRSFGDIKFDISAVAISPDGRYALTARTLRAGDSATFDADLWDISTGMEIRRFSGHTDNITSIEFSSDGHYVLTSSLDRTARLWDIATGAELRRFSGHKGSVTGVAISKDGH